MDTPTLSTFQGQVKNIRNLALIDRLYNLFKTEGGVKSPPQLLEGVQPVVDLHAFNMVNAAQNQVSTTVTTITHTFTVPVGKKWRILAATGYRYASSTGDCQIQLMSPAGAYVAVAFTADATTKLIWNPGTNIVLSEGGGVYFGYSTGASGSIRSDIFYEEIDA